MRKKRKEMERKERKMREKVGAAMGVGRSAMSRSSRTEKEGGAGEW